MQTREEMTIKPCPFCGQTKITYREGSTYRWLAVECENCGARGGEVYVSLTDDKAVAEQAALDAWNTRFDAGPCVAISDADKDAIISLLAKYRGGYIVPRVRWALDANGLLANRVCCLDSGDDWILAIESGEVSASMRDVSPEDATPIVQEAQRRDRLVVPAKRDLSAYRWVEIIITRQPKGYLLGYVAKLCVPVSGW